mgnify:FL=1
MGSNMSEKPGRNDLCHCGSGKKFKICHGRSSDRSYQLWIVVGVLSLAAIWFFTSGSEPTVTPLSSSSNSFSPQASNRTIPTGNPPPGKVWSSEHGHWHDSPTISATTTPNPGSKGQKPQPPGEPPPGKTWSSEHGHWHDSSSGALEKGSDLSIKEAKPKPNGEAPPGKTWSSEHGHWHDSPSVPATTGSGLNLKEPKLRPLGGLTPEKTQSSQ